LFRERRDCDAMHVHISEALPAPFLVAREAGGMCRDSV